MNNDYTLSEFIGQTIAKNRKENGLNQKDFAQIIGVSNTTLSLYERGERTPDVDTLLKIAEYFKLSLDELCGYNSSEAQTQGKMFNTLSDVINIKEKLETELGIELVFKHKAGLYSGGQTYNKIRYDNRYDVDKVFEEDMGSLVFCESKVGFIFNFDKVYNGEDISSKLYEHIHEFSELEKALNQSAMKDKIIDMYLNDTKKDFSNIPLTPIDEFEAIEPENTDDIYDDPDATDYDDDLPF